jgi:hypothetical protein
MAERCSAIFFILKSPLIPKRGAPVNFGIARNEFRADLRPDNEEPNWSIALAYLRPGAACGVLVGPSTMSVPSFKIFIRSIKTTRCSPVAVVRA